MAEARVLPDGRSVLGLGLDLVCSISSLFNNTATFALPIQPDLTLLNQDLPPSA
jgi:hypothetical protein